MLSGYIKRLMRGAPLLEDEAAEAFGLILDAHAPPPQASALLVALHIKGETEDELVGAARALRARMQPVALPAGPLIDSCGSGGDARGTFNLSTAAALVAASAGVTVAKQLHPAVSSRCGSVELFAALGVAAPLDVARVTACCERTRFAPLFAEVTHPRLAHLTAIARALNVRTAAPLLPPLANPAGATLQLTGVFDRKYLVPVASALGGLGAERAWVVHGADGTDELSVTDETLVAEWDHGVLREHVIRPEDVGLSRSPLEAVKGGTPAESAGILREVLSGERSGPVQDAVALNAGALLHLAGAAASLEEGVAAARDSLVAGHPGRVLDGLLEIVAGPGDP